MRIVMIGTGNVSVTLLKKLVAAGHKLLQVYGRNHLAAAVLADKFGAATCASLHSITQEADLYIIAVADKALASGEIELLLKDQLVVHTAGAVSKNVLEKMSSSYGVLYPFQTIRKEIEPVTEIPFLVDASNDAAMQKLYAFARSISTTVITANDEQRMQYHISAVMTNNFSNYLYVLVESFCTSKGLDFKVLLPLLDETTRRLHHFSPAKVQTGPAIRKDFATVEQHLAVLEHEPALKQLYQLFSDQMSRYPW